MYYVYILYSQSKNKYYVGQTNDLERRLLQHNSSQVTSTKFGAPWDLKYFFQLEERAASVQLEKKIKKRGAKRYLQDMLID